MALKTVLQHFRIGDVPHGPFHFTGLDAGWRPYCWHGKYFCVINRMTPGFNDGLHDFHTVMKSTDLGETWTKAAELGGYQEEFSEWMRVDYNTGSRGKYIYLAYHEPAAGLIVIERFNMETEVFDGTFGANGLAAGTAIPWEGRLHVRSDGTVILFPRNRNYFAYCLTASGAPDTLWHSVLTVIPGSLACIGNDDRLHHFRIDDGTTHLVSHVSFDKTNAASGVTDCGVTLAAGTAGYAPPVPVIVDGTLNVVLTLQRPNLSPFGPSSGAIAFRSALVTDMPGSAAYFRVCSMGDYVQGYCYSDNFRSTLRSFKFLPDGTWSTGTVLELDEDQVWPPGILDGTYAANNLDGRPGQVYVNINDRYHYFMREGCSCAPGDGEFGNLAY